MNEGTFLIVSMFALIFIGFIIGFLVGDGQGHELSQKALYAQMCDDNVSRQNKKYNKECAIRRIEKKYEN